MDPTLDSSRQDLLHGWKEVAAYLGRSPRAVQRYELELGLPIHRVRTMHGQTVYAYQQEIDHWRRTVDGQSTGGALRRSSQAPAQRSEVVATGEPGTEPSTQPAALAPMARPPRLSSNLGLISMALALVAVLLAGAATIGVILYVLSRNQP